MRVSIGIRTIRTISIALGLVGLAVSSASQAGGLLHETSRLEPPDAFAGSEFGRLTTVHRNAAVVVGGGADELFFYRRQHGGEWLLEQHDPFDLPGSVADLSINGNTFVVGLPGAPGGDAFAGEAYVFQRNESGPPWWVNVSQLISETPYNNARYGVVVDVDRDRLVVGRELTVFGPDRGRNYLYDRDASNPRQWNYSAFEEGDKVSLHDNRLVAGSPRDTGHSCDPGCLLAGGVYDREQDEVTGEWVLQRYIVDFTPQDFEQFGDEVDVNQDLILATAGPFNVAVHWREYDWEHRTYLSGKAARQRMSDRILMVDTEQVYEVIEDPETPVRRLVEIAPSDGHDGDRFAEGASVSIEGMTIVAGAPGHEVPCPAAERGCLSGAAYVFQVSDVAPVLSAIGSCSSEVVVELSGATPGGTVTLVSGTDWGASKLEDSTCPLARLDLAEPETLRQVTFPSAGSLVRVLSAPVDLCGRALQAIDETTCLTSEVAWIGGLVAPVVALTPDVEVGDVGVPWTAAGQVTDADSSAWWGEVDWGDGQLREIVEIDEVGGFALSHDYAEPGSYGVRISVVDDRRQAALATLDVEILGP